MIYIKKWNSAVPMPAPDTAAGQIASEGGGPSWPQIVNGPRATLVYIAVIGGVKSHLEHRSSGSSLTRKTSMIELKHLSNNMRHPNLSNWYTSSYLLVVGHSINPLNFNIKIDDSVKNNTNYSGFFTLN